MRDADPRRAVIACWVRLEQAAAAAGTPRQPGDTSTELVGRLLREHQVSADVLEAFAAVYREARFAPHEVDLGMRDQARAALRRLRDELDGASTTGAAVARAAGRGGRMMRVRPPDAAASAIRPTPASTTCSSSPTPRPAEPPARRPDPWVFRAVVHTAIASVVVAMAFMIFNLTPPYLVIVAVCAAAVLVRRAAQLTGEPHRGRTSEVIGPLPAVRSSDWGGWSYDGDGVRDAVRRWDRRLEWGATGPERYRVSVAGRLAELAEERLRQLHGITPAQDPARARQAAGRDHWDLLYGTGRYASGEVTPSAADVLAAVKRLESHVSGRPAPAGSRSSERGKEGICGPA